MVRDLQLVACPHCLSACAFKRRAYDQFRMPTHGLALLWIPLIYTFPQFSRIEILRAPAAPEESVFVILECCASPDVLQAVVTAPLLRLPGLVYTLKISLDI